MERADFELQVLHYDAFGLRTAVAILFKVDEEEDEDSDFLRAMGLIGPNNTLRIDTEEKQWVDASQLELASVRRCLTLPSNSSSIACRRF